MKTIKIFIWTIFAVSLACLAGSFFSQKNNSATYIYYAPKEDKPLIISKDDETSEMPDSKSPLPNSLLLPVPFTSQAPAANWDDPVYAEACEEASLYMASEYFGGNKDEIISKQDALEQIRLIANWETKEFGYNRDIDNAEITRVADELLGLNTKILEDFTEDDLKQALKNNQLVLIPTDGRLLNNPNFRAPGPPYHMLVIKGYDDVNFITNDPGTRNGRDYKYTFDVLYEAAGRWNHALNKVDIKNKTAIVVWK